MLHRTSSQSLVDLNLLVAERPIGRYGEEGLRKGEVLPCRSRGLEVQWTTAGQERRNERGGSCREPRLSSLVVVGRVSKGKLQPVGFSQQYAHFLVAPVHCGKVLQEDHQTLLEKKKGKKEEML